MSARIALRHRVHVLGKKDELATTPLQGEVVIA